MANRITEVVASIPLLRADLTRSDERAVRLQLASAPFQDAALLARWEAAWAVLWQRSAVACADPIQIIAALKRVLGWQAGDRIGVDPLLDPAWTEALAMAWLYPVWRDLDPNNGQGQGPFLEDGPTAGRLQAGFCQHPYGMPCRATTEHLPCWLEDLSALLRPLPSCGWGTVQLLYLSGNRMVAAGGSCLLLTQDEVLEREIRALRLPPPSPMACALGLSQLRTLEVRLARRQELAERYLRQLRGQGLFQLPTMGGDGRLWEMFLLTMASEADLFSLQQFLQKAHIHAASPLWFRAVHGQSMHLPGFHSFQQRTLALPLYASLNDSEQKRLINRVNRWVGYRRRAKPC